MAIGDVLLLILVISIFLFAVGFLVATVMFAKLIGSVEALLPLLVKLLEEHLEKRRKTDTHTV